MDQSTYDTADVAIPRQLFLAGLWPKLPPGWARVLPAILSFGPEAAPTMKELARATGQTPTGVWLLLSAMNRAGLLVMTRRDGADGQRRPKMLTLADLSDAAARAAILGKLAKMPRD